MAKEPLIEALTVGLPAIAATAEPEAHFHSRRDAAANYAARRRFHLRNSNRETVRDRVSFESENPASTPDNSTAELPYIVAIETEISFAIMIYRKNAGETRARGECVSRRILAYWNDAIERAAI